MDNNTKIAIMAALVMAVALVIAIFGLQSRPAVTKAAEATPAPVSTPEPTPEPPAGIAISPENAAFEAAVRERLPEGFELTSVDAADITLMYMPEPIDVGRIEGAKVIFTDKPHIVVNGAAGAVVDNDEIIRASWDALYTYPTHSTPIRLLTLLSDAEGVAYSIYESMLSEGKLQDKGLYIEEAAEISAKEWVAQTLDSIPVGLLDTIYAENAGLAVAAYEALRADGRNDSVEVICAELNEELVRLMIDDHWSMGAAIGVSFGEAVDSMLKLMEGINNGETATVAIPPRVILSDDVYALSKEGMGAEEIVAELMG